MKNTGRKVERASAGVLGEARESQGMRVNAWMVKRAGSGARGGRWVWAVSANAGALQRTILAQGLSNDLTEIFSEQCCSQTLFMLEPSPF